VHAGLDDATISDNAKKLNATFVPPLEQNEVDRTVKSATGYRKNSQIPLTDLGNAERLRRDARGLLLYVAEEKVWRQFDGQRWVHLAGAAERQAHETIRRIVLEAGPDPDSIQAYSRWQKTSESTSRIKAVLEIAASLEGMSISKSELDRDANLINFRNGTYELDTGSFREHRASDFITKIAQVSFDPAANAPRFEEFVNEIMDGDPDDKRYLQKLTGYTLSGDRPQQIIQFLKGDGGDGKSVFIETIRKLSPHYFHLDFDNQKISKSLTRDGYKSNLQTLFWTNKFIGAVTGGTELFAAVSSYLFAGIRVHCFGPKSRIQR